MYAIQVIRCLYGIRTNVINKETNDVYILVCMYVVLPLSLHTFIYLCGAMLKVCLDMIVLIMYKCQLINTFVSLLSTMFH